MKGGSLTENLDNNDENLDDILPNKIFYMEIALQVDSNDKTVRSDTIQALKEFNSQSLSMRAEKGEQLVSMMPAIKKDFNLIGDDIVKLSTKSDALKNRLLR